MWFKCGADILKSTVFRDVESAKRYKDNGGRLRKYAVIELLSETAEDRADDLQDADDLARLVDTTPKQAQIVWDILIKHNVLRKGPQGYSAKAWMIERGILGGARKWQRRDERQEQIESKNIFGG